MDENSASVTGLTEGIYQVHAKATADTFLSESVTEFGPGTVAVVVYEDGTEEIVRDCVLGENGVVLGVEGDVTLKIVDNTQTFKDVEPLDRWATKEVEFVAARQLFNGKDDRLAPKDHATRAEVTAIFMRF